MRNGTGTTKSPTFIVENGVYNAQEYIHHRDGTDLRQIVNFPVEQDIWKIQVFDEENQVVDFQGSEWSFILRKLVVEDNFNAYK